MKSNPETVQICRQLIRILLSSAMVFGTGNFQRSADMDCFQQQKDLTWVAGWTEHRPGNIQEKAAMPLSSSLALVHIILIARTGVQLASVDLRPILVVQDGWEE